MPIVIDGKSYEIWLAYCEACPSKEMVEHAKREWTPAMQAEWDRHQKCYRTHLLAAAMGRPDQDVDEMERFIAKYDGDLFVGGPLVDCSAADCEGVDAYGGKVRGGQKDGNWKLTRCVCCGALLRNWPVPG